LTPAALSLAVYGIYLLANGAGLVIAPNLSLALLGLPPSQEVWIRVLGLVSGELGFYFLFAARNGISSFFPVTVYARGVAAAVFVALVVFKLGPTQLLLFAAIDLLAASWTQFAIRRERAL
jgi:hypothetical protein